MNTCKKFALLAIGLLFLGFGGCINKSADNQIINQAALTESDAKLSEIGQTAEESEEKKLKITFETYWDHWGVGSSAPLGFIIRMEGIINQTIPIGGRTGKTEPILNGEEIYTFSHSYAGSGFDLFFVKDENTLQIQKLDKAECEPIRGEVICPSPSSKEVILTLELLPETLLEFDRTHITEAD